MDTQCAETPLVDLLRGIPKDHRITVPMMWDEAGREIGHSMIPVGLLMHRAADELATAQAPMLVDETYEMAPRAAAEYYRDQARAAQARVAELEAALRAEAQPKRDWTEDAAHENGEYSCLCSTCGNRFVGHKRRVTCKACTHPQPGPEGWKLVPPDLLRQLRHYTECHLMLYKDCGAPTVEEVDAMLAAAPGAPK